MRNRRPSAAQMGITGDFWPLCLLVVFAGFLYRGLLAGNLPASGDHQCHLFKGWLMAEHLIPSGRLTGWTHMAFAGYPAGKYYPIGADLYLTAWRYGTLGLVSWDMVYCLALFFALLLIPISVYALARRACGPVGAFIGALLAAGDVGGWRQGGSVFTIYWGVWPYMLAVCFSLIALSTVEPVLKSALRSRPGLAIALAVLLALAVLTHPMAAVFFGAAIPVFMAAFWLARRKETSPGQILTRASAAGGLAVLLALFWLAPQLVEGARWTESFGEPWLPLGRIPGALLENRLFDHFSPVAWALGLAGIVSALVSCRLWPSFFGVLILLLLLLAGCNLPWLVQKIQMERLSGFMKAVWFVLAGVGTERIGALGARAILRAVGRDKAERLGPRLPAIGRACGLAVAAAVVIADWSGHFSRVSRYKTFDPEQRADIFRAYDWLAAQPRGPLDRVLYQPGPLCVSGNVRSSRCRSTYNEHLFAGSPVRTGLPKVKFGFEPATVFRNLPLTNHWPRDAEIIQQLQQRPDALENLGVKWVVSLAPWPDRPDLKEVVRFGPVRIYSVLSRGDSPVRIEGSGSVAIKRFDDETVAVIVKDAAPGSVLRFPIAYHPAWQAEARATMLPVEPRPIAPGLRSVLVSVPAVDGQTTLRFVRFAHQRLANWLSGIAWAGCAVVVVFAWRRRRANTQKS